MKKILILLICLLPVITFTACDDKDDIRKDIDDLNARLDALEDDLVDLNTGIKSFQDAMKGLVLITDYSMDEKGNYTLTLSDGKKLVIYSGQPAGEIPTLGVNDAGNWTYTLNGETKELTDKDGNPCPAVPVDGKDGKTPTISIDSDGYWCYAIEGGEVQRIEGRYNIANIEKIPGGIFSSVTVEGNNMTFGFADGSTTIPLLGGLNLAFSNVSGELTSVTVAKAGSITITATPTNVDNIIIDQTPFKVNLTDAASDNLTISAKGVAAGEYTVYFQIFSKEGYRLIKPLKVTVSE
ncbi:PL29 family lyase N-terminal domain-containing protein [Bacteroides sp.]|uniref:PL29 family lyase N-terminal domain-containing protein n=1 Tax=Bacteroides sp. TaxID=29523 RepID=UPI0025B83D52|nr:PL29 family lyase N-terminal domain-containing protein [Bacteroides sp.]